MRFIVTFLLAALTLLVISLQKTYSLVPTKELRRRARAGDEVAKLLYKAVGYGYSLKVVLWILIGVSGGGFFVFVAHVWPVWLAILLSVLVIWLGYLWLPESQASSFSTKLAGWLAPALAKVISFIHPLVDKCVAFVLRHHPVRVHTGMYDRSDLIEILDKQQVQADNRIEKSELEIAHYALIFGDKKVQDVLTPRRVTKAVSADESIGPVLMTELHDSGHSRFPVYEGEQDKIVGVVYLRDLTKSKVSGKVRDIMRDSEVCYLHEDQPLTEALQAIIKTGRHLMIVVNSFEEYVGIITIEDVLEQIIGKQIVDEFDQYEDLRAVAAKAAAKDHKKHEDHTENQ